MRCAECGLYECCLRTPLGGCPNGETTAKFLGRITTPNSSPYDHGMISVYDLGRGGIGIIEAEYKKLADASKALVDAVEGYVMPKKGDKYVFRNEVLARCKELKELLK